MISALVWSALFTLLFVGSLYTRGVEDRNDPAVMKRRMIGVLVVSLICMLVTEFLVCAGGERLTTLGLGPLRHLASVCAQALLHVTVLFLGPIVHELLDSREASCMAQFRQLTGLQLVRNLVVGPVSEEIVFRACVVSTYLCTGDGGSSSHGSAVLISSLFFGLAHLHHVINHVRHQGLSVRAAVQLALFQLCYTSVFGSYVAWLYLASDRSLTAVVLVHMFCNAMGFPAVDRDLFARHRLLIASSFVAGLLGFIGLFKVLF